MNIVFVSAEVAPWSKTGGLGDVVGGLPVELAKRGHRVITMAPRYVTLAQELSPCVINSNVLVEIRADATRI
jgi:granule-bound starch synthase